MKTENHHLQMAIAVAIAAHAGQYRRDGVTPYHTHPEKVARLVGDMIPYDYPEYIDALIVAHLHDILEDTKVTVDNLKEILGY